MTKFTDDQIRHAYSVTHSIGAAARSLGMDRRGLARRLRALGAVATPKTAAKVSDKPFKRYIVIPDCQVKPGVPLDYLHHIGSYVQDQAPDVVVNLGDFADMPSLSSYDKGKKSFEGRRYKKDIKAAHTGLAILDQYRVLDAEYHMLYGNHENRITRVVENQPELEDVVGLTDLQYDQYGWTTHGFLEPVHLDGICFSHYFVSGVMGRPIVSAQTLLNRKHQSCIAGHQQGKQIAYAVRADGKTITGMIVGSAYPHDEDYMGPQGNRHWRGIVVLNEVRDGTFDEMFVSLDYLRRRYG